MMVKTEMKTKTVFRKQQMIIEYKYQKVIDLCGNFTIFTYIHKWQMAEKVHRILYNNRNTMEHQD